MARSLYYSLLYQKVSQPKDSLQSYLCAVYLDPQSLASWVNMGCLYESAAQPMYVCTTIMIVTLKSEGYSPLGPNLDFPPCKLIMYSPKSPRQDYLFFSGFYLHWFDPT